MGFLDPTEDCEEELKISHPMAVAVVGCGGWGMNHVRTWHDLGRLRLAVDPDPDRRAAVTAAFPAVETAESMEEAVGRLDIDAVVLATPATSHAELAIMAMEHGKDVLVEKPLALNVRDGERVVDVAERLGRTLLVGHVLEYHPALRELRRLLNEGVLGRLRYVYSNRLNFGKVRTEENALWSFAPHDIALVLRIIGADPVSVSCSGQSYLSPGIADVTLTSMSFASEAQAHIFVSWLHPFKEQRFVVVGDQQMAVFDDTAPWDQKLVLYPHQVNWAGGSVPVAHRAEGVAIKLLPCEPLTAECQDFAKAVEERSRPLADGATAVRVLRVLEAAGRSMQNGGQPVAVTAVGGDSVSVHPTATIDIGAELGSGTKVWHYSHVMKAHVGRNCVLGQNVFIGDGVRIGERVRIQNNVSVYEGVTLEDDVFCGPSAVFTNVVNPRAEVTRRDEFRRTLVRKGATLGANCTIVCGTTIGEYAFVGAGAVVTKDVPAHTVVIGVPARPHGWVSRRGVPLQFSNGEATCTESGERYMLEGDVATPVE